MLFGCQESHKYPYAINDFRASLQSNLIDIVNQGIVGFDKSTRYVQTHCTNEQLKKLSLSEHPILRAVALRALTERKDVDNFELVMSHLDDTAIIAMDAGEWGVWFRTVSDDLIGSSTWRSEEEKNKTIKKVITQHNYLQSAYTIVSKIKLTEEYYPYIKKMIDKERPFDELEYALYALASYKRKEDVSLIKQKLMKHDWKLGWTSFRLMKEFPEETYLEVLQSYSDKIDYGFCEHGMVDKASGYFTSLAVYKNEKSADLLMKSLDEIRGVKCDIDTSYLKAKLIHAVWNNKCPAYKKLLELTREQNLEYQKVYEFVDSGTKSIEVPDVKQEIRW